MLDNLRGHTIRKTVEVDRRVTSVCNLTYAEYCEELADMLYDKVACGHSVSVRWTRDFEHGVRMPTTYPASGVAWRYKVVD